VEGTSQSTGDRHVLIYRFSGPGTHPALYEMWQGIYVNPGWTDSSNRAVAEHERNALTPQGKGTSDASRAAGGALLVNADEVIGTGTPRRPTAPCATHQVHAESYADYWVWPSTQTAGVGFPARKKGGGTISRRVGNIAGEPARPAAR